MVTLILCIDTSESMGYGEPLKLSQAIDAARKAALNVQEPLSVGIVTFDVTAEVLIDHKPLDPNEIYASLTNLSPKGLSCIAEGLKTSIDLAMESKDNTKIIFLLTDGRANLSLDHMSGYEGSIALEEELIEIAEKAAQEKILINTVSIGEDAFTGTLQAIARRSGGEHFLFENFMENSKIKDKVLEAHTLHVHSVPTELPSAQPTWTKESQFLHVAVVSQYLFDKYRGHRRAFLINPLNGRIARTALISIESNILKGYVERRPKTASLVRNKESILLDKSYREYLRLQRKDLVELKIF